MIELRGLHLGNIARSPAESVRPDLWPDHSWVPALGCTGGVLYDLCGGMSATIDLSALEWISGVGLRVAVAISTGIIDIGNVPAVGGYTFSAQSTATWTYHGGVCSLLGTEGQNSPSWPNHGGRLILQYGRYVVGGQVFGPVGPIYATGSSSVRSWAGAARAGGSEGVIYADGVEVPGSAITGHILDTVPLSLLGGMYSESVFIAKAGSTLSSFLYYGSWRPEVLPALHTDPILPFRRRQTVYYSVPSGGGSTGTPAAMLMGI